MPSTRSIISSFSTLRRKTISWNTSSCYDAKYRTIIIMYLKSLLLITKSAMFILVGHDTTRPLGIQFRSFAYSVHDIRYHKCCTAFTIYIATCVIYYPILRHMVNNFTIGVTSWQLVFKFTYWYLGMSMFNYQLRCICKHMKLAI